MQCYAITETLLLNLIYRILDVRRFTVKDCTEPCTHQIPPITHCIFSKHIKGATSRFLHLEKFSLNSSTSSFAIRVNLLHPQPSRFRFGLFLPIWRLSALANSNFKENFLYQKNDSKYNDIALLSNSCSKRYLIQGCVSN